MSIPSWAVRRAKVVCVASPEVIAAAKALHPWGNYPETGQVYTVRGHVYDSKGEGLLLLVEISNPPQPSCVGVVEWGFEVSKFRPLVAPKTEAEDLAHFRHHLTQNTPVDA